MSRPFVLSLLLLLSFSAGAETVEESARRVLTTKNFPFCDELSEPTPLKGSDWCEIQEAASVCPKLAKACELEAPPGFFERLVRRMASVEGGGTDGAMQKFLEGLNLAWLRFVLWGLFGLLLGVVLFFVLRAVLFRRQKTVLDVPVQASPELLQILVDPGLSEVSSLLARAREAASRDLPLAFSLLYAALLRHLSDRSLIEWEPSKTNRDYVRAVRGKTPLDQPLAELVREVERVKFGRRSPDASKFEQLYSKVSTGVGSALSLLLVVFLSGCGDPGLEGRAAFNEIAEAQGFKLESWSRPLSSAGADDPLIILDTNEVPLTKAVLHSLHDSMLAGGRFLVLSSVPQRLQAWPQLNVVQGDYYGVDPDEEELDPDNEELDPDVEELDPDNEALDPDKEALDPDNQGLDPDNEDLDPDNQDLDPDNEALDPDNEEGHPDSPMPAHDSPMPAHDSPGPAHDSPKPAHDGQDQASSCQDQGEEASGEGCGPVMDAFPTVIAPTAEFAQRLGIEDSLEGHLPAGFHFRHFEELHDAPETLLHREGSAFALRWKSEHGELVLVADRRLFVNASMAVPENARLAFALVESMAGEDRRLAMARIEFENPPENPAESLGRAGLWVFMLQSLLVLGLLFWSRGAAFGALRDRDEVRRRTFAEHVSALGQELERREGSRVSASMYAGWALDRLRRRVSREMEGHDSAALAKALHRVLGDDETSLRRLIENAEHLRNSPAGVPRDSVDLTLIIRLGRLLSRLQSETTGSARKETDTP